MFCRVSPCSSAFACGIDFSLRTPLESKQEEFEPMVCADCFLGGEGGWGVGFLHQRVSDTTADFGPQPPIPSNLLNVSVWPLFSGNEGKRSQNPRSSKSALPWSVLCVCVFFGGGLHWL